MKEEIRMQRTFLLRDAEGRNVDVVGKLYRLGGNARAHFSVTSQNGSNHEAILEAAPDAVREDLAALVAVHLMDDEGTPMHAAANAAYHLEKGDFPAAHNSLDGAGTLEDLYRIYGESSTAASNGTKAEVARYRHEIATAAKAAKAIEERVAKADLRVRRGETTFAFTAKDKQALTQLVKDTGEALKLRELDLEMLHRIDAKLPENLENRVSVAYRRNLLTESLAKHVEEVCRPVWEAAIGRAKQALSAPDYRAEGRPAIDEDDTTFEGFVKAQGLGFEFERDSARRDPDWKDGTFYTWTLSRGDASVSGRFGKGSGHAYGLTAEDVLESFQSDFASVACARDRDDFLNELGFTDSIESVRRGERAYDEIVAQRDAFIEGFGEEAFRHLMTKVGDNPPLTEDFFEEAPAPRP